MYAPSPLLGCDCVCANLCVCVCVNIDLEQTQSELADMQPAIKFCAVKGLLQVIMHRDVC